MWGTSQRLKIKIYRGLKFLKPLHLPVLFPWFKTCGFILSCSFVGEEEKARGSSRGQVSNLKLMPLEESSSQWRTMKQPKIILVDLLTSQAMKSWQGRTRPLKKTTVTKPWRLKGLGHKLGMRNTSNCQLISIWIYHLQFGNVLISIQWQIPGKNFVWLYDFWLAFS